MYRGTGFIFILLTVLIFANCAKNIREYRAGDDNAPCKILIAATVSDFRETIIEGLLKNYHQKCSIKVINLNNLKYIDSRDYDVIVLIDRALAWTMFNFAIRRFIDTVDDKGKVVLFMSAGSTNWKLQVNEVDGITGASKTGDVNSLVRQLVIEIDERLGKHIVSNKTENSESNDIDNKEK